MSREQSSSLETNRTLSLGGILGGARKRPSEAYQDSTLSEEGRTHAQKTPSDKVLSQTLFLPTMTRRTVALVLFALGGFGLLATSLELINDQGDMTQALFSYLVAFFFALTICLGCLFFVMLQHLVGAVWSVTVRRIAEAMSSILPVFVPLFLPIALGIHKIYPWAKDPHELPKAAALELEEILAQKGAFLNPRFFLIRAAVYLLCWSFLGSWVYFRSRKLDQTGDLTQIKKLRRGSPPAMLIFGLSLTFAGFDWVMSLDPTWFSTMFGVYVFAGAVVSSLATITAVALFLRRAGLLKNLITQEHYHDLGKLTFGFVVFWAYIAFSQYFLIWYANIPEETHWYGMRWFLNNGQMFTPSHEGWWAWIAKGLILCQFFVPFWLLLSRFSKRSPVFLGISAGVLLVAHYLDLYWFIIPELHKTGNAFHWFDITALLGVVGTVGGVFVYRLGSAALVPIKDPFLQESMEFENV